MSWEVDAWPFYLSGWSWARSFEVPAEESWRAETGEGGFYALRLWDWLEAFYAFDAACMDMNWWVHTYAIGRNRRGSMIDEWYWRNIKCNIMNEVVFVLEGAVHPIVKCEL